MLLLLAKADYDARYKRLLVRRAGGDPAAMAREDAAISARVGQVRYLTEAECRAAAREALPKVGDRVEFQSDRRTDKGPCEHVPVIRVEGENVTLDHGGGEHETHYWPGLDARRRGAPGNWLVKADYTHPNPSPGQQEAGNYAKRKVFWRGLTISIENEKGAVRTGAASDGTTWRRPMYAAYGYINRTLGVDGDQVDCYLGPNLDAPNVFVVHQRTYGDWEKWDEDKVMIGWPDEASARAAYLRQYDDPRFLGPITTLSAEAFVQKVKATKDEPAMIKGGLVLFVRRG